MFSSYCHVFLIRLIRNYILIILPLDPLRRRRRILLLLIRVDVDVMFCAPEIGFQGKSEKKTFVNMHRQCIFLMFEVSLCT